MPPDPLTRVPPCDSVASPGNAPAPPPDPLDIPADGENRRAIPLVGPSELETVRKNFLMKKLGLPDSPALIEAINAVIDTYGRSERTKYRAVVYYMLTRHFGKEAVYK